MLGGYVPWGFVGDFLEGWSLNLSTLPETSTFSAPENSICLEDPKHIPFVAKGFWGLFPEATKRSLFGFTESDTSLECVCV